MIIAWSRASRNLSHFGFLGLGRAYEQFLESHAAEYERLDAAGEEMTLKERKIGWYEGMQE
jgi:hypothetical protein